MAAIVIDGHLKSALAAVRSLGRNGIVVMCGAERVSALALHSRYVSNVFVYQSPKHHPEAFIQDVIVHARELHIQTGEKPVVFSFSDASSLALSRSRELLSEHVHLPMPEKEAVEIASDKEKTYALAMELSIPTITTYKEEAFNAVAYPAVVKHRHSIVWREGGAVTGSAAFVFSRQELDAVFARVSETAGEHPLVMECIVGDEYGIEMVCNRGVVLSEFAHKRIRSLSPRGGAAVVKETAAESSELVLMRNYAHTLVVKLAWHGPVMVEFKVNAKTGQVYLMEINGRFWGSLPLAIAAGVDFPVVAYNLSHGAAQKPAAFVPHRVRTRHFLGDCKWLFSVLFSHDPLRPILYPSRVRAMYEFKKEFFLAIGDIFSWDDPAPALFEYIDIVTRLALNRQKR